MEIMVVLMALVSCIAIGVYFYWRGRTHQQQSMTDGPNATESLTWTKVDELIEHDRQRISSDLHDELGTVLSLIHLDLEFVMRETDNLPPHIEAKLNTVKDNLNLTIDTIRNIIWNLSPDFIEGMSLNFAIRELCHKFDALKGTHVHFVQSGTPIQISQRQKLNLFRMVQEAFSNAIKHSNAWNISVHVHWEKSKLIISVEDDGSNYRQGVDKGPGMGTMNISKRAQRVGARVRYETLSPRGLRVSMEVNLSDKSTPARARLADLEQLS